MDTRRLIDIFRGTIEPTQRLEAEEQLEQMKKIIGFAPSLLQLLMMADVDMPVRQASAIYLKNMITKHWSEKENCDPIQITFTIHEQDRSMIRDSIVDAVVLAPDLIQLQLAGCVNVMVKYDFPDRWTQIVDKISIYLQNPESAGWQGALICLHQLVKIFEYRKPEERAPLNDAMNLLLPMTNQLCFRLLPDESEQSLLLQKQILKIFFALTQYVLPLNLITKEMFSQWMEVIRQIVNRPGPAPQSQVILEEELPDLPWWKCKKWAIHILFRMFERYGSPGNVEKEYNDFSQWFLKTFSGGFLEVLLKLLDQHIRKIYVSPRVIQLTLNYIGLAVSHAHSWKYLKDHMFAIIQDVVFPLLSYSAADEELWESDPKEYIRIKFDIFEDLVSPVNAAASLLTTACKKRKNMLQRTMNLVMHILTTSSEHRQRDGALHMVGTLADILFKKKPYKEQMEPMLVTYVFPEFSSPHGHMRARACWVLHYLHEIKFRNDENLTNAVRLVTNALLTDSELPVRVEAAIALQMLLSEQEKVETMLTSQVKPITLELLKIIRETEIDELTGVLQKIVCTYSEQITPIASDICQHLAATFSMVLESDEGTDEKAIAAMGILNTIETLISVMEDQPAIIEQLQPIVLQVVVHILTHWVQEFYEEAMSLIYDLTTKAISSDMWKVLELMYQVFEKNGLDYFTDMMPALHNYVVVDTPAFLSNQNHVLAMYNMCKTILTTDAGEDPECHAAKLLEVIILQCKGQIDHCIQSFIELVLQRLTKEIKTSELRAMCLQVVIAALYYNPQLWIDTMDKIQLSMPPTESISAHFIKQWLHDSDCFLGLHDRKLCVLGMTTLLSMGTSRPSAVIECAAMIIPCLILVFDGLKRAYAAKASLGLDEEESEEEASDDEDVLSTDEDEINENTQYLENIKDKVMKGKNSMESSFQITAAMQDGSEDDDDEEDDDYEGDDNGLEAYTTPIDENSSEIDEYVIFKHVLQTLERSDPIWYSALTSHLTPDQQNSLREVMVLADQRKAAAESKKIEQSGGYQFINQAVPTTFNFGGKPLGR